MAKTLTLALQPVIQATYTNTIDLQTGQAPYSQSTSFATTSGTGLDQMDLFFSDQRSVSSGTPDDLDLAGGLTDVYGATLTFVKIKLIFIYNTTLTAASILNIGGDANGLVNWVGAATHTVNVTPGGFLYVYAPSAAGYAVTGGTGDILQIACASGTSVYNVVIGGTSA